MEYRICKGLSLSEVGIGCYGLSGAYGAKDAGAYRRMIERACELGVNLFDTADSYGPAEEILGEALRPRRAQVHIATKVGARGGPKPGSLAREPLKRACEGSLQRLQTDYIDLYQVHYDDPQTPVAETVAWPWRSSCGRARSATMASVICRLSGWRRISTLGTSSRR